VLNLANPKRANPFILDGSYCIQEGALYRFARPFMGASPMGAHEQFAEDLALYSLGALEGKAKCALELHLDSCAFCQNELRQLQREVALLALSVFGPFPRRQVRKRLLQSVARKTAFCRNPVRLHNYPTSLTMSALSSPFFSFFLPFLFFHGRTTPFTPRSGLVGLVHLSFDDHGSFRNLSVGFSPTQTSLRSKLQP